MKILKVKYREIIQNKKWFNQAIQKSKHLVIPLFDKTPLYDVIVLFIRGLHKGTIKTRASAISFKFFLAIFPSLLFFFTIIPYLPINELQPTLMDLMRGFMPEKIFEATQSTITDIIQHKRGGLLSIGILLTLIFATNGITSIFEAFNNTIHITEKRSFLRQRITAIFLLLIVSTIIIISVSLIIFGTDFLNYLVKKDIINPGLEYTLIAIGKWIIALAMVFFSISFIYYMAPSKKFKFRLISAGSTLSTLLLILTSVLFNFFVSNFGRYNALYGSIGTLIVFMLYIYFNSIILLIGFELNASIRYASRLNNSQK